MALILGDGHGQVSGLNGLKLEEEGLRLFGLHLGQRHVVPLNNLLKMLKKTFFSSVWKQEKNDIRKRNLNHTYGLRICLKDTLAYFSFFKCQYGHKRKIS